jgi:hypothetical protein
MTVDLKSTPLKTPRLIDEGCLVGCKLFENFNRTVVIRFN